MFDEERILIEDYVGLISHEAGKRRSGRSLFSGYNEAVT
jgi:hypothetical protein